MSVEQHYLGYDPGGNGNHGVAALSVAVGSPSNLETACCSTAEDAVKWFARYPSPTAVGIDTLMAWSGSRNGYRRADCKLRSRYPEVQNSVVAPNSLYGSMCLSGPWLASKLLALAPATPPY